MTCASCVGRVEKKLNRLEGVARPSTWPPRPRRSTTTRGCVDVETLVADRRAHRLHRRAWPRTTPRRPRPTTRQPHDQRLPAPAAGGGPADGRSCWCWRCCPASPTRSPVRWTRCCSPTPVVLWAGWPFHRAAALNARHGASTMDTLVSLGTLVAYGWSVVQAVTGGMHIYVEVAATVTTFLLLGRWTRVPREAAGGIGAARAARARREARRRCSTTTVASALVDVSACCVPACGSWCVPASRSPPTAWSSRAARGVDESMLTGESVPVEKQPGDEVVGAHPEHRRAGWSSRSPGSAATPRSPGSPTWCGTRRPTKAPVQRLADRVSAVFVPVVLAVAVLTFAVWALLGDPTGGFTAAVAVLVIACPCALGLATPTALLVGTGRAAQLGIVIRDAGVLESTRRDRHRRARQDRHRHHRADGGARGGHPPRRGGPAGRRARRRPSSTPSAARSRSTSPAPVRSRGSPRARRSPDFANHAGHRRLRAWSTAPRRASAGRPPPSRCRPPTLRLPALRARAGGARPPGAQGAPPCSSRSTSGLRPCSTSATRVKDTSADAVRRLRGLGLHPVLLTGDHATTARAVAAEVGIDEVVAEVLPADKAAAVARLRQAGAWSRWSATASTTRPRWSRPTSGSRWAPAPRPPSRPAT